MKIEQGNFESLPFILHAPDDFDKTKQYPILLHLHGAGTRGITLEQYAASANFETIQRSAGNRLVILSPHCTMNTWYDKFETLIRFANSIKELPFADPSRIYLMGVSMGGYAAWQLAMSQPTLFAAMIPICGGGMCWNASRLKDIPIWAFHGGKDTTVLPEESIRIVEKVNKRGGSAKLTVYPENEHNAWDDTFKNPEVFTWLLSHKNKNAPVLEKDEYNGREAFG